MSDQSRGQSRRFIVGVTGNIATGKSAIMKLAAEEGALAIDADKLVHEIMDSDGDIQAAIAVAFGSEVRRPDGRVNRRALGEIVFNDADAMRDLEGIVHPAVHETLTRRIDESSQPLIFIEAIKLLEGKLADSCQQIWVTRCSQQKQLERLRVCRGMDTATAAARIKAQSSQEDKAALADVVIETDGNMADTEAKFFEAWAKLPAEAIEPVTTTETAEPEAAPGKKKAAPPAGRSRLTKETARLLNIPKPKSQLAKKAKPPKPAEPAETEPADASGALEVRRARPSDIPSILLLIQKATDGALKMKRSELLMAFSERSYFIGQTGTDVSAIMGWNIDYQVARIDQIFVHPLSAAAQTGAAIISEIEKSANEHICELIVAFIASGAPAVMRQLFTAQGFEESDRASLPQTWQTAIEESQPEDTVLLVKVLRDDRLKRARVN